MDIKLEHVLLIHSKQLKLKGKTQKLMDPKTPKTQEKYSKLKEKLKFFGIFEILLFKKRAKGEA